MKRVMTMFTCPPNSFKLTSVLHLWDNKGNKGQSMEATPLDLQEYKDLLLTSWCQILQRYSRGQVESVWSGRCYFRKVTVLLLNVKAFGLPFVGAEMPHICETVRAELLSPGESLDVCCCVNVHVGSPTVVCQQ